MILSWLFYSTLIGGAAAAGAAALARLLRVARVPTRGAWMGAMAITVGAPLAAFLRHGAAITVTDPVASTALLGPALASTWKITAGATDVPWLAASLLVAWAVSSCLLLVRFGGGVTRLRHSMATWPQREVDGVRVRVSRGVGPAVAGIVTSEVIVPTWLLDLDAASRALVLRHEEEHRQARDPLALAAASLACCLVPWNVALWWQRSRLRLAVEMDCDARVLRRTTDVHGYGLLLVDIAQRFDAGAPRPAAALSEPASFLEWRITAMTTRPSRHPLSLATLAVVVLTAVAFACAAPAPTNASNGPSPRSEPARRASGAQPGNYVEFRIEKPAMPKPGSAAPRYPAEMRRQGIEGEVLVQFVVDTTGLIIPSTLKVIRATNATFVAAVRDALPGVLFDPAEVGGRKVKQLFTMPFVFSLAK